MKQKEEGSGLSPESKTFEHLNTPQGPEPIKIKGEIAH
jgi:hypothetical protein